MRGAGQTGPERGADRRQRQRDRAAAAERRRDASAARFRRVPHDAAEAGSGADRRRPEDARRARRPHVPRQSRRAAVQGVGALAQARQRGRGAAPRAAHEALVARARRRRARGRAEAADRARPQRGRRARRAAQPRPADARGAANGAPPASAGRAQRAGRRDPEAFDRLALAAPAVAGEAGDDGRRARSCSTNVVNGRIQQQINPNLPPALRSRIEQLHNDYQKRFQNDAKTTIADFEKTRQDLSRRYAELHGIDSASQQGAQNQIASLRKKRGDLYDQMVAQIDREVRVIAQQRGISVVLTNVVAPAGGVDLTPDALKDIESLHE